MEKIDNVLDAFNNNLSSIDQLGKIGSDVSDILLGMLADLKKQNEKFSGFLPYKQKLDNILSQIENIKII